MCRSAWSLGWEAQLLRRGWRCGESCRQCSPWSRGSPGVSRLFPAQRTVLVPQQELVFLSASLGWWPWRDAFLLVDLLRRTFLCCLRTPRSRDSEETSVGSLFSSQVPTGPEAAHCRFPASLEQRETTRVVRRGGRPGQRGGVLVAGWVSTRS